MAILKSIFKKHKVAMAYKTLFDMSTPLARSVLKDMCVAHGVFDGGFDEDPYTHAFKSGERNAVLRILTIIQTPLQDIVELAEEDD